MNLNKDLNRIDKIVADCNYLIELIIQAKLVPEFLTFSKISVELFYLMRSYPEQYLNPYLFKKLIKFYIEYIK
jgi:hypothetical protein